MPVQCPSCGATFSDDTYLYGGAKTKAKAGADISGKATRKDLFAAGDYANIQHTARLANAGQTPVSIHLVRDSITLGGLFFRPTNGSLGGVVLLLSGSGGTVADYCGPIVTGYQQMGMSVLAVDYRGFGGNAGTPSSRGTYSDAAAMLDFLTAPTSQNGKGFDVGEVVVHGYSLGSGPATELAKNNGGIAGLVLHCPMSSAAQNAREAMGGGVTGWLAAQITATGHGYNNEKKIPHVTAPVHIITGQQDDMAPQGQLLFNKSNSTQKSNHAYNGDHFDTARIFNGGHLRAFVTTCVS